MFAGFGQATATPLTWSTVGTSLLNVGTGYLTAEAQKTVAESQAQLLAAQQQLVTAQTEYAKAQTAAQAGIGGFDIGKMGPVLLIGIGIVLFLTFREGSRKR